MPTLIDALLIVLGVVVVALSRTIAYGFRVPRQSSETVNALARFAIMSDDYPSRLFRWIIAVLTGLAFAAVGVSDLLSR